MSKFNAPPYLSEIAQCCPSESEEEKVDQPEPQRILPRAGELEMSCKTSREQRLTGEEGRLQEELRELLGRWTKLNKQSEARAAAALASEETSLRELNERKREAAHYKNLLLKEESLGEKSDTRRRKLEEENRKMTAELALVKSLKGKHMAEIKKLRSALPHVQEKQDFLNKLIEIMTEKMSRLSSQKRKQYEENKNLRAAVKDLQDQLDESNQEIWDKDELTAKQSQKLAHKTVEVISALDTEMKMSARALRGQRETEQEEEEVPAGVETVGGDPAMAGNAGHLDSPEEQRAESLPETPESQTGPLWRHCAKGLGIATVGIRLMTWALWSTR